jgi:hypothetical protein
MLWMLAFCTTLPHLQALKALRLMNEQLYYGKCNSSTTTEGVHVDATSAFSRVRARSNFNWAARMYGGHEGSRMPGKMQLESLT